MPTFDTPDPILATINVVSGTVRVSATQTATTSVTVQPSDASDADDRKAAELTRVDCAGGELHIRAPRLRSWLPRSDGGSIDLVVQLPAGSQLQASGQLADFTCDGRLGDCRMKTGIGHIQLDEGATLSLRTGIGDVSVGHATGDVDIRAGSGDVRAGELDAGAIVKNSNGDTTVGRARGELRISAANGNITIDAAAAGVVAKSANGDIRLGEAVRRTVVLETKLGDLEVGIREGTAAWLDVRALAGRVHNDLATTAAPDSTAETVRVRARTSGGDVVIRRPS